jgi:hypothetical protein
MERWGPTGRGPAGATDPAILYIRVLGDDKLDFRYLVDVAIGFD